VACLPAVIHEWLKRSHDSRPCRLFITMAAVHTADGDKFASVMEVKIVNYCAANFTQLWLCDATKMAAATKCSPKQATVMVPELKYASTDWNKAISMLHGVRDCRWGAACVPLPRSWLHWIWPAWQAMGRLVDGPVNGCLRFVTHRILTFRLHSADTTHHLHPRTACIKDYPVH